MEPLGEKVTIMWTECSESTNKELRKGIDGLDNLSVIAARNQTAGRGQGAHTWFSSPDTNLTFSMLYRFPGSGPESVKVADMLLITMITTTGIRDYLSAKGIQARIKWPNDIWVRDRKICGILIENIIDGDHISESIVGIGLDVNETGWPEDLPNPVSMKELTGTDYNLETELMELTAHIASRYLQAGSAEGRKQLDEEFGRYLFRLPEAQR